MYLMLHLWILELFCVWLALSNEVLTCSPLPALVGAAHSSRQDFAKSCRNGFSKCLSYVFVTLRIHVQGVSGRKIEYFSVTLFALPESAG